MADGPLRVLVVDDEPQVIRALRPALAAAGYEVAAAESGGETLELLAGEGFDVVLLDLGLPDIDGKAVIVRIREWSDTPILVLSAREGEAEKIAALDLGADDFVNKPFAVGELLARIRAAIRGHERRLSSRAHFQAGPLTINFADRRIKAYGEEVRLTPREYDLLRVLARHAGKVVTHKHLITAIWGHDASVDPQFVRVLVAQLRQKLEEDSSAPKIILTEPGVGYRLISEDDHPLISAV